MKRVWGIPGRGGRWSREESRVMAACVHDDSTLFVQDVLYPHARDAGQTLHLHATIPTQPFISRGTLDVALAAGIRRRVPAGQPARAPRSTPQQLETETSNINIQGAVVRITDAAGNQLNTFTTPRRPARSTPPRAPCRGTRRFAVTTITRHGRQRSRRHGRATRERRHDPLVSYAKFFGQTLGRHVRRVQRVRVPRGRLPRLPRLVLAPGRRARLLPLPNCALGVRRPRSSATSRRPASSGRTSRSTAPSAWNPACPRGRARHDDSGRARPGVALTSRALARMRRACTFWRLAALLLGCRGGERRPARPAWGSRPAASSRTSSARRPAAARSTSGRGRTCCCCATAPRHGGRALRRTWRRRASTNLDVGRRRSSGCSRVASDLPLVVSRRGLRARRQTAARGPRGWRGRCSSARGATTSTPGTAWRSGLFAQTRWVPEPPATMDVVVGPAARRRAPRHPVDLRLRGPDALSRTRESSTRNRPSSTRTVRALDEERPVLEQDPPRPRRGTARPRAGPPRPRRGTARRRAGPSPTSTGNRPSSSRTLPTSTRNRPSSSRTLAVLDGEPPVLEQDLRVLDEESGVLEQDLRVLDEEPAVLEQDLRVLDEESPVLEQDLRVLDEEPGVHARDPVIRCKLPTWIAAPSSCASPGRATAS